MPRKDRHKRRRLRDLSDVKSRKNGGGRNLGGSPKGSVTPAFEPVHENGIVVLRTRTGKRIDRRTYICRRFEQLLADLIQEKGGLEVVTISELQILRRAACLAVELESEEASYLNGETKNLSDAYGVLAERQRKMLTTIGLKRRARDITPDPLDYARSKTIDGTAEAAE